MGEAMPENGAERKGGMGLRALIGIRLLGIGVLVFVLMLVTSFFAITQEKLDDATALMGSEAFYVVDVVVSSELSQEAITKLESVMEVHESDAAELSVSTLRQLTSVTRRLLMFLEYNHGLVMVFDNDGRIIASNNYDLSKFKTIDEVFAPPIIEAIDRCASKDELEYVHSSDFIAEGELVGEDSFTRHEENGYLYASQLEDGCVVLIKSEGKVFDGRAESMAWSAVTGAVMLVAVFILVFVMLNRQVARRIDKTNADLARIVDGDLDVSVEAGGTREFRSLSAGINSTVDALKGWIAEAESRMDSELAAARAIQASALPCNFPPFPDIPHFDVHALMDPAREVGGDFYDFFLIGGDSGPEAGKLGFVIADVSGKGVPAALFMMKAKTEIRANMEDGLELGEAVTLANRKLCEGNSESMFVTAWVGVLDYAAGHVEFVNAGHNPPLLKHGDSWTWLKERSGPMLGLYDRKPYKVFAVDCAAGDELLLYTDGVTEAWNRDEQLYGEERLQTLVESAGGLGARQLVEAVRADVAAHADGAEQNDDITILALQVGVAPEA